MLTPRESIVQKLYKSHAQPFVRVVRGVPELWGFNTAAAAVSTHGFVKAAWSPCNRFVATCPGRTGGVDILDSATLQRLQNLGFSREVAPPSAALAFSPDGRILTSFITHDYTLYTKWFLVSWDLHTGGVVSAIERNPPLGWELEEAHITFSMGGKIAAVLSQHYLSTAIISIFDVVSGVYLYDVDLHASTDPDPALCGIWAHGDSFRFATHRQLGVTVWEIGFALGATPTEVQSFSIEPDFIPAEPTFLPRKPNDITWAKFHPASYRLTLIPIGVTGIILVWDAWASKFLLHDTGVKCLGSMAFSSHGHFFLCTTTPSAVHLWNESPIGYTHSKSFAPSARDSKLLLSPNGESLITFHPSTIVLWDIKGFSSSSSSVLTPPPDSSPFLLEFHPDRPLVALARKKDKTVMVFDLKPGAPELTIDTSIKVYGLRPIGNSVVVVGDEKAITWDLPGGDPLPGARMNIGDSIRSINFHGPSNARVVAAAISPNLQYIALSYLKEGSGFLDVYCTSTLRKLHDTVFASALRFVPGGHDICCASQRRAEVFTISQGALSCLTREVANVEDGSCGSPWGSSPGYQVTHDRSILGAGGKRLLMMPPLWGSPSKIYRVWNGKFLALLHDALPEPVILELEP